MRTKVQEIRKQAIDSIKSSIGLLKCLQMVDIDEGNSPIVCEDRYDENLTTTLDNIEQDENRNLTFYHSSACSNGWLREDEMPTDALIDIAEFLEEHKEQIQEIINETDTTADDDNMSRDMFVKDTYHMAHKLNNGDNYEHLCNVVLTKDKYPIAFEEKVQELLEEGCATSREEAEKMVSEMEIELEIYYEKGCGLFAVESGAAESGCIYSPYTKEEYTD